MAAEPGHDDVRQSGFALEVPSHVNAALNVTVYLPAGKRLTA
jgi:hypothetical protein